MAKYERNDLTSDDTVVYTDGLKMDLGAGADIYCMNYWNIH